MHSGPLVIANLLGIAANLRLPETLNVIPIRILLARQFAVLRIGAISLAMILVALVKRIPYRVCATTRTLNVAAYPPVVAHTAVILVALVKRIPYRVCATTRTLNVAAYLPVVAHTAVLMNLVPAPAVKCLLLLGGVASEVMALNRQIGRRRRVSGQVRRVRQFPKMKVTEADVCRGIGWPGHKAGQSVFVTFDYKEGAAPFTIASARDGSAPSITVISNALARRSSMLLCRTVGCPSPGRPTVARSGAAWPWTERLTPSKAMRSLM